MADRSFDIVIIGGGVMGCACAYFLLEMDDALRIAIIERDPTYERSSTALSDGNLRVQFNIRENIQISLFGLEILEQFDDLFAVEGEQLDPGFRQQGNLFLIDPEGRAEAERGLALQQRLGAQVTWLNADEIRSRYPFLELGELVGGTFGPQDGTMSPMAVLRAYRRKALSMGAVFLEGEVTCILSEGSRVHGVEMADGNALNANAIVNCAGAWAPGLAEPLGIELPVKPTMRQVYVVETELRLETVLPAIFFPSGLYLIHEREGRFMCGRSFPDDPVTTVDFRWDRKRFEERLWPELVERIPAFDRLRIVTGWAGLYAVNTFDGNAILGEWPTREGYFLATGFSGHGFQQCHAVGRYLAERILGKPPALDLSVFSPQRLLNNHPVFESERKLI